MLCYIYKSFKKDELYLYIEKKDDFSNIPDTLLKSFGKPEFVMDLELTTESRLAREDTGQVILQLQEKGFFVQMPPTHVILSSNVQ